MMRRIRGLGLALLSAFPFLTGCETLKQEVRTPKEPALEDVAEAAPEEGEVKSEAPRGFFKSSRLSGALSDEGREIERDLGIR